MKCHFIYDKRCGKILIPGCMGVAVYGDMRRCTCRPETFKQFEKKEYNEAMKNMKLQIKELEQENARLWRIIKRFQKGNSSK